MNRFGTEKHTYPDGKVVHRVIDRKHEELQSNRIRSEHDTQGKATYHASKLNSAQDAINAIASDIKLRETQRSQQ